jgi:hypothetical protein
MGRPPIGKQAMTSTERSRRRREQMHQKEIENARELDGSINDAIRELEAIKGESITLSLVELAEIIHAAAEDGIHCEWNGIPSMDASARITAHQLRLMTLSGDDAFEDEMEAWDNWMDRHDTPADA